MYSPGIRSTIGGSVHPFENKDPLGKALADSVEQGAANAVQSVINWYQNASAHQEGIGDDLLRLMAGGVRNTTNAWKAATAEQEGITDDILRGVGWTAGKGMQVLDAGSYYLGKGGGAIGRMVGVDPRITGAVGNVVGDVLAGGLIAKGAKVAKVGQRVTNLSGKVVSKIDETGIGVTRAVDRALQPQLAYATDAGQYLDDAADLVPTKFAAKTLPEITTVNGIPRYKTPVGPLTTGNIKRTGDKASGLLGTEDIASLGISKQETALFNKLKALQKEIGAHHHVFDHKLAGDALNRADAKQIVKELRKLGVRPGNSRYNLIMAFHEKSGKFTKEFHDQIQLQRKAKGLSPLTQRQLDDLTKNPLAKEGIFRGNPDIPEFARAGELMTKPVQSYDNYYSRFREFGIDRKKIKLNPKNFILGQDHLEIIHEAYKQVPAWQEVQGLIKSGQWRTLPPKEAAKKLAEINRIQTNIAIKVSQYRLGLVKKHIRDLHTRKGVVSSKGRLILNNPKHIRKWMVDNPAEAATLGWGKQTPTLEQMMGKPGEYFETTKELRAIFDTGIGKPKLTKEQLKVGAASITAGQVLSITPKTR